MNKNHKRISAAVLSLALGFTIAGAPMMTPFAGAQAAIISPDNVSTVNLDANVSLTINKYSGEPTTVTPIPNSPLQGVQFEIQKIALPVGQDLDTLDGWKYVANLDPATLTSSDFDTTFGTVPLTTDGTGNASISTVTNPTATNETVNLDFTVGAYLVTELQHQNYTVAKPFIVTLPFTESTGTGWNYHQTVNPKNQTVTVEKDVTDFGVQLGDDITYTISASIPAEPLTKLDIVDDLPDELSAASNVLVYTRTNSTEPASSWTLLSSTNYTATLNAPGYGAPGDPGYIATGDGNLLTVTFNDFTELNTRRSTNPGLEVVVTFNSTVIELPTDGEIRNDVIVNYPNVSAGTDPQDPTDGASTRLGELTVTKRDTNNNPIVGDFATFQLWQCSLVGTQWTVSAGDPLDIIQDPTITTKTALDAYLAGPPTATLPTEFSTDPNTGEAKIYGVQAYNWVNGAQTAESNICLVETKAPEGYSLNPEPQPVETYTNAADPAVGNYAMTASVTNLADDELGTLPATGGKGTLALIAAGLAVAVAGGAAALRGNRLRK